MTVRIGLAYTSRARPEPEGERQNGRSGAILLDK